MKVYFNCAFVGRAFGHFEKPLFMELCKHVEIKFVPAGAILFRPGLKDDSIYVVRNGCLKVYIIEPVSQVGNFNCTLVIGVVHAMQDGTELPLKEAGPGDSVHSMLSILDALTGHPKPFKSVAAKALRDTYLLQYVNCMVFVLRSCCICRVHCKAFQNFFEDNPDSLLRMVQVCERSKVIFWRVVSIFSILLVV